MYVACDDLTHGKKVLTILCLNLNQAARTATAAALGENVSAAKAVKR